MPNWPVEIVVSDPRWVDQFALIRNELTIFLREAGGLAAIEHLGSTAVPGLAAKNIIDVLIGVDALAMVNAHWVAVLEGLGYRYVPKHEAVLPMRRFFARAPDAKLHRPAIIVHLHVVEPTSEFWREHLLFRDALRADAATRDTYAKLKRQLAAEYRADRDGYTEAKSAFILGVVARASAAIHD